MPPFPNEVWPGPGEPAFLSPQGLSLPESTAALVCNVYKCTSFVLPGVNPVALWLHNILLKWDLT